MHRLVASFFGTGLILGRARRSDQGSGTLASVFALGAVLALAPIGWWAQLLAAAVTSALSVWSADPYSLDDPGSVPGVPATKEGDPGWVVIDEAAGTFLATIGLSPAPAVLAWLVFRAADIFKTVFPGVSIAERLPGGWGVTADDLVAAIYGLGAGWLLTWAL